MDWPPVVLQQGQMPLLHLRAVPWEVHKEPLRMPLQGPRWALALVALAASLGGLVASLGGPVVSQGVLMPLVQAPYLGEAPSPFRQTRGPSPAP